MGGAADFDVSLSDVMTPYIPAPAASIADPAAQGFALESEMPLAYHPPILSEMRLRTCSTAIKSQLV